MKTQTSEPAARSRTRVDKAAASMQDQAGMKRVATQQAAEKGAETVEEVERQPQDVQPPSDAMRLNNQARLRTGKAAPAPALQRLPR